MCLIHLQSIKMKNRIGFKYCRGICLMHYVWNTLNIILEVIETFHTHSPCVLRVCCMHWGHTGWVASLRMERFWQHKFPWKHKSPAPSPPELAWLSQLQWEQINEIQIYPGQAVPELQGMIAAGFSTQPVKAAIKPFSNGYFCKYTRAGNIPG